MRPSNYNLTPTQLIRSLRVSFTDLKASMEKMQSDLEELLPRERLPQLEADAGRRAQILDFIEEAVRSLQLSQLNNSVR